MTRPHKNTAPKVEAIVDSLNARDFGQLSWTMVEDAILELETLTMGYPEYERWTLPCLLRTIPDLSESNAAELFLHLANFGQQCRNDLFSAEHMECFRRRIASALGGEGANSAYHRYDLGLHAGFMLAVLGVEGREAFKRFIGREKVLAIAKHHLTSRSSKPGDEEEAHDSRTAAPGRPGAKIVRL